MYAHSLFWVNHTATSKVSATRLQGSYARASSAALPASGWHGGRDLDLRHLPHIWRIAPHAETGMPTGGRPHSLAPQICMTQQASHKSLTNSVDCWIAPTSTWLAQLSRGSCGNQLRESLAPTPGRIHQLGVSFYESTLCWGCIKGRPN